MQHLLSHSVLYCVLSAVYNVYLVLAGVLKFISLLYLITNVCRLFLVDLSTLNTVYCKYNKLFNDCFGSIAVSQWTIQKMVWFIGFLRFSFSNLTDYHFKVYLFAFLLGGEN